MHATLDKIKDTLRLHSGRYICVACNRSYKYKRGLNQHVRFECGKAPQEKCPYCPYKAKLKYAVKSHLALKHNAFII
ncbi:longitudinals lacking protein, isoforms A/B/D/L-like [Rhodnius prolixus]|uniref:longitudinals lacking protein, isoforms A/B/D/L-like n=1 Tax=Rhodnius prolixus TaxID=13249 RepID=UPI003D18ED57